MKKFILLFSLLTVLLSCNKNKDVVLSMTDYPLNVGDQWTYQQTFYDFPAVDTSILTITGKTVSNDSTIFYTQTTIQGAVFDSGVIIMTSNELKYVPSEVYYCLFDYTHLQFPMKGHSVWTGEAQYDSLRVVAFNQKMTVMGNTYNNVVEIIRTQYDPQYFESDDTLYICPRLGVIYVGTHVLTVPQKMVRLISYHLN